LLHRLLFPVDETPQTHTQPQQKEGFICSCKYCL